MKKTLTWLGVTVGSLAVFAGAGFGLTLVNKDSLATHLIEKYTGTNNDSVSSSANKSAQVSSEDDNLNVIKSTNLDSILNNGEYNGSAALNTGKKILVSSRGYSNHTKKDSMTQNSRFLIGKVQDTINNAIIMHLIDTGEIKLSDKLAKYDNKVAGADLVTVKDIMNQTSGIDSSFFSDSGSANTLIKKVDLDATYDSSKQGTYSDTQVNTVLQAKIIEKVTGDDYRTVVQELLDQLGLENTRFGIKEKSVDYYKNGDSISPKKVNNSDLDTATINRMGEDQLVSSPGDIAQLYNYLFNSDYISSSTLDKVFKEASGHIAGFSVNGHSVSLAQIITGGRNRIEWNLKKHQGSFLFSNYINGEDNLASISVNMFDYLN